MANNFVVKNGLAIPSIPNGCALVMCNGCVIGTTPSNLFISGCGASSTIRNNVNNTASGNYSASLSGANNSASGYYAIVAGGRCNTTSNIYTSYSGILSGCCNNVCGSFSVIVGGGCNTISNNYATISGGYGNVIGGSATAAFIGSGNCNSALCGNSVVVGGYLNVSSGPGSFVGNGNDNTASGSYSAVLNGICNTASGTHSGAGGCGVTNTCNFTFQWNCLRASNLIGTTVAVCVGTDGILVRGTSDVRCKTDITPLSYGLNEVYKLNPVSFNWCDDIKSTFGDNRQLGFIAQEVEKVIPEAVGQSSEGVYSMDINKIVPALVKSLQEISDRLDKLENKS